MDQTTPSTTDRLSSDALEKKLSAYLDELPARTPDAAGLIEDGRAIATIARELGVDPTMLAGTHLFLLVRHDIVSLTQIDKTFGPEIKNLVRELVKLSEFGLPANWEPGATLGGRQIDALRKMLLAIAEDVRLVLVRLAEQLHRLRGVKAAEDTQRKQVALETREIFSPLASRLGIWQIKWELEDLSFRYLDPAQYKKIANWLDERRADREAYIARMIDQLGQHISNAGVRGDVAGRPKHIYSIWRKMQRKDVSFQEVFDVRAVRILLDNVADCYTVLGIVHGNWRYLPGEFDDYIATPKDNNYQSLHTAVIGPEQKTIEIQIRTHDMHAHAELGVAAHWSYKEGTSANPSYHKKINWLRSILEPGHEDLEGGPDDEPDGNVPAGSKARSHDSNDDFIDRFKSEVFEDRVYAMTPAGDVIDLPAGATPLDFAYYVHTELGHRCRGAKVHGRIVPLTHTLNNGDVIDIITAKEARPSRDWLIPKLGYLESSRARAKVRTWFRRQDQEHTVAQGQALLEKEIRRLGLEDIPHVSEIARELKLDSATGLYAALGHGDLTINDVLRVIQRLTTPRIADDPLPTVTSKASASGDDIEIAGVGDLLTTMARCCKPVPPDRICGYITQGRGVTIHRRDCGNAMQLEHTHPERFLEVAWNSATPQKYPVDVVVEAYDREGLLKDITALLSADKVNIAAVNLSRDEQSLAVKLDMTLEISGLDELSRVLHRINSLSNVFTATRA